ncbi:MFS transporter [Paenibacillus sp. GCM10012307]|uniref:MFS transporter n=1 Tax=Paenibacillus roseus TaxID=2798579 RepID=A0A934MPV3_9BACL|nr:MFS transporter [Paenibacillus roseus]MBJ6360774.1 MFS transporter [Paenibacillus roseus]
MRKLIWMGCLSYLVIGMAHVVAGAILEPLIASYGLDYRSGGQFIMNQFLGFLGGVLITPWLSGRIGRRNTLLLALGSLTLAEGLYSLFLPWGWMLTIAPVAGFGFGMTEAIIGVMIIEYVEEKKASAMTFIETFFGVGALVMPIIAAFLIKNSSWELSFPIVAVMSAVTMLLWLTMSFGRVDELMVRKPQLKKEERPVRVRYPVGSMPILVLGTLFFMIYVGMEMSFSNYLPSIMIERLGLKEAEAASTISMFWGLMVVGRLFAGRVAEWSGYGRFLVATTGAGTLCLIALTLVGQASLSLFIIGLSGLVWAGVFAIGLVYMNHLLIGHTERTTSLLVAFGGLGGALFPKLTGWLMDRYNANWTLAMLAAMTVVMLIIMIVLAILERGRKKSALIMHDKSCG